MNDYLWETEEELANNTLTMNDWLDHHIDDTWDIIFHDGTYAEIKTNDNLVYEVHAGGNGDFKNHKVEFKLMYGDAT